MIIVEWISKENSLKQMQLRFYAVETHNQKGKALKPGTEIAIFTINSFLSQIINVSFP